MKCLIGLALILVLLGTQKQSANALKYKKIIKYLGTDFILPDGCPPPDCDEELRDCRKQKIDQETEYEACLEYV